MKTISRLLLLYLLNVPWFAHAAATILAGPSADTTGAGEAVAATPRLACFYRLMSRPFRAEDVCFGMSTWGFTPGYHMTGFQPSGQRRIVSVPGASISDFTIAQKRIMLGWR